MAATLLVDVHHTLRFAPGDTVSSTTAGQESQRDGPSVAALVPVHGMDSCFKS
jgi:hypothetical protein